MISFFDLTISQQTVLVNHARGMRSDHVGREVAELGSYELRAAGELVKLGLIAFREGWRETGWYSITERGWNSIGI